MSNTNDEFEMAMVMRPFNEFKNASQLVVFWLNNDESEKRSVPNSWCQVWNESPHRFCTDGAANLLRELCIQKRIKPPNTISGDMDSINQEALEYFKNLSQIRETPDQDFTDLTKALDLIGETEAVNYGGAKAILILGGLSGRFDHTLSTLNSVHNFIAKKRLPTYVVDSKNLVTILPTGSSEIHLDKTKLTNKCGLLPLCQRETRVTSEGLKWNLNDQCLEYGGLVSSSNEIESEELLVHTNTPIVFSCELRTAESFLLA
ncbi:Thiamine pyrophosphokinase [Aphelenchoides bicaudatus]|nr:Thiamine pyrophosphokinase [Aphelenchoides bicaudatus]